MKQEPMPPHAQMMQYIVGRWISKPLYVAAELGIADLLAEEGPLTPEALAEKTGVQAPFLYRILRALAAVGVFQEDEQQRFGLTPLSDCLRTGAMRSMARMFNADWNDLAWMHLMEGVRTGRTPFETAHGMPFFAWLERHPEAARLVNEANSVKAATSHRAIVEVYGFEGIGSITDVGGGTGALLMAVLEAHPTMTGVVADLPQVVPEAEAAIRATGMEARCRTQACDFFHWVPDGSDACMLSHVLHDWPDEACSVVLGCCREALPPGGRLLVVEMVVPPGNAFSVAKLLDMEMMVVTGGRERTEEEYRGLLEAAGFRLVQVVSTPEAVCLLEAVRR